MLMERAPRPHEVGRSPAEVHDALILRVMRDGTALGFSRPELRIEAGDKLVIVSPAPVSANAGVAPA